jgi:hypothetical protein
MFMEKLISRLAGFKTEVGNVEPEPQGFISRDDKSWMYSFILYAGIISEALGRSVCICLMEEVEALHPQIGSRK